MTKTKQEIAELFAGAIVRAKLAVAEAIVSAVHEELGPETAHLVRREVEDIEEHNL